MVLLKKRNDATVRPMGKIFSTSVKKHPHAVQKDDVDGIKNEIDRTKLSV